MKISRILYVFCAVYMLNEQPIETIAIVNCYALSGI